MLAIPTVSILRSGSRADDVEEEAGMLPDCDTLQRKIKNKYIRKTSILA